MDGRSVPNKRRAKLYGELCVRNPLVISVQEDQIRTGVFTVKNTGTNMEIITDIPDLPKLYIDKRTNILAKNGDKYDTISKDQIRPGRKVNLLLFNTSMKDWFLARIVLLP